MLQSTPWLSLQVRKRLISVRWVEVALPENSHRHNCPQSHGLSALHASYTHTAYCRFLHTSCASREAIWRGKLTLHVHIRRLVHEVHEELRSVNEDLVPTVTDGAVPPCALKHTKMSEDKYAYDKGCATVSCKLLSGTYHNNRKDDHKGEAIYQQHLHRQKLLSAVKLCIHIRSLLTFTG